jgi:hypothetical protein
MQPPGPFFIPDFSSPSHNPLPFEIPVMIQNRSKKVSGPIYVPAYPRFDTATGRTG